MIKDIYGQIILTESELCDEYLKNPDKQFLSTLVDKPILFDSNLELEKIPELLEYNVSTMSMSEFDQVNQTVWLMPEQYKQMDIAKYVLDKCKSDAELQRVGQELLLYQELGMFSLLQYLKYLVDIMKANDIVWGVGRGSSVASFVLYLLEVHKINSLHYDLDIVEFLKVGQNHA